MVVVKMRFELLRRGTKAEFLGSSKESLPPVYHCVRFKESILTSVKRQLCNKFLMLSSQIPFPSFTNFIFYFQEKNGLALNICCHYRIVSLKYLHCILISVFSRYVNLHMRWEALTWGSWFYKHTKKHKIQFDRKAWDNWEPFWEKIILKR